MSVLGKQERKLVAARNADFRKKEEIFNCEICGLIFHQTHHLSAHIARVHEEKRPAKCKFCDFSC